MRNDKNSLDTPLLNFVFDCATLWHCGIGEFLSKMDTNRALRLLGRPGAYCIALYCLMFAVNMFAAFNHVSLPSLYGIPMQYT